MLTPIKKILGGCCVIAASGPSMCQEVADRCQEFDVIAISDTWRLFPNAKVLYSGDAAWWHIHEGVPEFCGERWSSYHSSEDPDKSEIAARYHLHLVMTHHLDGFALEPDTLHYGANSGFAALNLAIQMGATKIILTGYDMRYVDGKAHWFGSHPEGLRNPKPNGFNDWTLKFDRAAKDVPSHIRIINATPNSALTCFETMDLCDALVA